MAWKNLTETEVRVGLAGAEYDGLMGAALASGQTEETLLAKYIAVVARLVRGYVAGNTANRLGDDETTIPDELEDVCLILIMEQIARRVSYALSDERKEALKRAMAILKDVSTGAFAIVQPDDVSSELIARQGQTQIVSVTNRLSGRSRTRGLL